MNTICNTLPKNRRVSICIDTTNECRTYKDQEEYLIDLSDEFTKSDLIDTASPDKYLFFNLDGSERQLRECFGTIASSAVYTPEYDGIIGFEISQLTLPRNERSAELFLNLLEEKRTQDNSYVVLFVRNVMAPFSARYLRRLENVLDLINTDMNKRR